MVKAYDGDFEYDEAAKFPTDFRSLSASIKHPDIKKIASALERSMERVIRLHHFAIELLYWAGVHNGLCTKAQINSGLSNLTPEAAWSDSKFQAELKKLGDEKNAAFQSKGRDAAFDEIWAIGNRFIKGMLKGALLDHTEDPRLISGIESILSAMLQSSYDAFEAAVADAWIETINHDKKAAKAWAKDSANQKKNLSVSEIADIGFNLSGGFGTFLQQRNKVAFHSLEDIKRAYSQAFKGQADQCFSRDLAEAAEVRHLVTHRGGLIDRKFKNATKTFPEYQLLQEGTYLQLKGPLVKRLATACVDSAVALLKYCDERLSSVSAS